MTVREAMTSRTELATPDMNLRDAARLMRDCDIGSLPVGENDRLVGILTDRDITVRAVALGKVPSECKVRDIMSHEVKYIYDDDSTEDAAKNMAELQMRRLPVLNREKRLVGILSLGDLALKKKSSAADALKGVSRHT